jgi:hypothetical protein
MQEKMWILMSKREISCTQNTSILQRKQIFQKRTGLFTITNKS